MGQQEKINQIQNKPNSIRLLEKKKIPYKVFEFPPDIHSAEGVAEAVGVPPEIVFKSLIAIGPDGSPVIALIPGGKRLNLKKLGSLLGGKKAKMASHDDAEYLTGLKVGGISALSLIHKKWPVFIDASALEHEWILVSAGVRGLNLGIQTKQLIDLVKARIEEIGMRDEKATGEMNYTSPPRTTK